MNDLLGLALSPIVSCAAPVSRPLASSANSSIQKYSVDRIQLPIVLDFHSDEGVEEIRDWYCKQPTIRFSRVEHRKETTGRFRHEFVVVHLDNSTICRFDRRAREDKRGHALKDKGPESEDSAHVITRVDTEARARLDESEVLMKFTTGWEQAEDLKFILAVCCGIQTHPKAKSYSLLHYNCYFFSWSLVMIIDRRVRQQQARRLYSAKLPPNQGWIHGFCDMLAREIAVSNTHSQKQPFWGRLTRLGWPAVGANLHRESLIHPVDDYICKGMNKELGEKFSTRLVSGLDKILFPSQISLWLKREVFSALQKGGRLGVKQFLDEDDAYSQRNGKLSTPVPPTNEEINTRHSSTSSITYLDDTYRPFEDHVQRQAETKLMRYEKLIDTFIANSSDLRIWSDIRWSQSNAVYQHINVRMADHFKQVEGYGFGKAERSIKRAEGSMTEIWLDVLDMMKDE